MYISYSSNANGSANVPYVRKNFEVEPHLNFPPLDLKQKQTGGED